MNAGSPSVTIPKACACLVDPVAECRGQEAAEPGDVLDQHAEGPHAAVALPDAQHHKVPLRMPGDPHPGPALVQEHIPAARQRRRVLHRPSVVAPPLRFKAHPPDCEHLTAGFSTFLAYSSNSTPAAARVPP